MVREAENGAVIGIAQRAIAAGEYFWALVDGLGYAIAHDDVDAGDPLRLDTDGEGELVDPAAEPTVASVLNAPSAYALDAAAAGDLVPIQAKVPTCISVPPFRGGQSQIARSQRLPLATTARRRPGVSKQLGDRSPIQPSRGGLAAVRILVSEDSPSLG